MATLEHLRHALREALAPQQLLSDEQYSTGFAIFMQDPRQRIYSDFIVPQLTRLLTTRYKSHERVSVLEVGPGPYTILAHLPNYLRRKINAYTAFGTNVSWETCFP
jgi:hypothetical protein